ncbi:DEAD/DEAH box helicase family protein [Streptomyces sp. SID625]|nr:DEAD/DEAH box helicase family protein [Streptomyces sp. SID625]
MHLTHHSPNLLPHQQEATEALSKSLSDLSRVTAVMACGTGKTRVGGEVAGRVGDAGSKHRLVVVPTLELVRQTMWEWEHQLGRDRLGRVVAVCSDKEVLGAHRSGLRGEFEDTQVVNDAARLAAISTGPGPLTVACTYASLPTLAAAQARHGMTPADIAVIDEAHRTAGAVGKPWASILYDDVIAARRRLCLTATPRILDGDGDGVISMADESLYGPVGYRLSFATAIDLGLLASYRVVVPVVTSSEAHQLLSRDGAFLRIGSASMAAHMLANQLAVLRAAREHGIRRMITYHGSVAEAKWFANLLHHAHALLPPDQRPGAVTATHVHGKQTMTQRRRALDLLAGPGDGLVVVSNARVLLEGVDIPAVDAVCFLSPLGTIAAIQATGRAMRLTDRSRPKTATIMVPVVLQPHQDPESALTTSSFGPVWQTVRALASHDETLQRQLETARRSLARPGTREGACLDAGTEGVLPDWLSVTGIPMPPDFASAISVRTVRTATTAWPEYLAAAELYRVENGDLRVPDSYRTPTGLFLGQVISYLRKRYREGKLTPSQIEKWETVGMEWKVRESDLQELIYELREFAKEYGHRDVPRNYVVKRGNLEYPLGEKCAAIRSTYAAGKISASKVATLNAEGFIWNRREHAWNTFIADCREFMLFHGHLDVPQAYIRRGRKIGAKVAEIRSHPERLTPQQRDQLDRIGFIWDSLQYRWDLHINAVTAFKSHHGHLRIPKNYVVEKPLRIRPRAWLGKCVVAYRKGRLRPERHQQLLALGFEFPDE